MTEPVPARVALVAVETDLAVHVVDLLQVAGIDAQALHGDALDTIEVPQEDLEHARATLDLVLPGLLAEESGELLPPDAPDRLSGRLIRRSDWAADEHSADPQRPRPPLIDGRSIFAAAESGTTSSPGPVDDPAMQDDFIPPEPPPIPRGDTVSRFAWLGAIGGPILLLLMALLGLPRVVGAVGLAGFVIGFGVLVARMPDRARQDDGWDDGAVL